MALPTFLAKQFAPLDIYSIAGYPNHVPACHQWNSYFPRSSGNTERRPNQHLKDFHVCMEQQGIFLEEVQMKLFKWSLDEDARVWFKMIPHGSVSSLKCFHTKFY